MSIIAEKSPEGMATAQQLSKGALTELQKGATVELWVLCPPLKVEANGATTSESKIVLFHLQKALMRHFSPKWKRELAGNENANHIDVPFQKAPVKLTVSWMMAGVGDELGTGTDPYPKTNSNNL